MKFQQVEVEFTRTIKIKSLFPSYFNLSDIHSFLDKFSNYAIEDWEGVSWKRTHTEIAVVHIPAEHCVMDETPYRNSAPLYPPFTDADQFVIDDHHPTFVRPSETDWWRATEEQILDERRSEYNPDQLRLFSE